MKVLNYEECILKISELNRLQVEIKLRLHNEQYIDLKERKAKIDLEILGIANAMMREMKVIIK